MSGFDRKYPDGRLNGNDEGELKMTLFIDKNTLILNFGKPVGWIGLDKQSALALAEQLKQRAEELK